MKTRFRHIFLVGGAALVLAALYLTDPDKGLSTGMLLLSLVSPILAVGFTHLARKALHDYTEADARALFRKAGEHPIGAGLALVSLAIVTYGLLALFGGAARAQDVRSFIPPAAEVHRLTLKAEQMAHWRDHPRPEVLPALIEHESCITLRHARCWNPASRLKSAREEGAGLGQITRAWHPDGRLRFDALAEMRERHPALREIDWSNVYNRPDLQLRAVVLKSRDDFVALRLVADPIERLAFADAAYNGGLGGVQRERRACEIKDGCDPQRWWGHVEHTCLKSRQPLYGTRSACDINRFHVEDVIRIRSPKYRGWISSVPEIGGSEHLIQRKLAAIPRVDRVVFDPQATRPVQQVHGLPVEGDQMHRLTVVGPLCFGGCPPAITRLVPAGSIDAVYGHSIWALAHVGKEIVERLPSFADSDALVVVVLGGGSLPGAAPGDHSAPDVVSPGATHAVSSVLSAPDLLLKTPAGFDIPRHQPGGGGFSGIAAVAQTLPVSGAVSDAFVFNNDETLKPVADFQRSHVIPYWFINMTIVNDVLRVRAPKYRGWL